MLEKTSPVSGSQTYTGSDYARTRTTYRAADKMLTDANSRPHGTHTGSDTVKTTSLSQRLIQVFSPLHYFSLRNIDQQLNRLAANIFRMIAGDDSLAACSNTRAALALTATLPLRLMIEANRLIIDEVTGWVDITNFADHLQLLGCNPIPEHYYIFGDHFRCGSALHGSASIQPYVTSDECIAIKGRFAVLTMVYKSLGLA